MKINLLVGAILSQLLLVTPASADDAASEAPKPDAPADRTGFVHAGFTGAFGRNFAAGFHAGYEHRFSLAPNHGLLLGARFVYFSGRNWIVSDYDDQIVTRTSAGAAVELGYEANLTGGSWLKAGPVVAIEPSLSGGSHRLILVPGVAGAFFRMGGMEIQAVGGGAFASVYTGTVSTSGSAGIFRVSGGAVF